MDTMQFQTILHSRTTQGLNV
ncbi:MAG: hypothetical protein V2A53_02590 [bacterium]